MIQLEFKLKSWENFERLLSSLDVERCLHLSAPLYIVRQPTNIDALQQSDVRYRRMGEDAMSRHECGRTGRSAMKDIRELGSPTILLPLFHFLTWATESCTLLCPWSYILVGCKYLKSGYVKLFMRTLQHKAVALQTLQTRRSVSPLRSCRGHSCSSSLTLPVFRERISVNSLSTETASRKTFAFHQARHSITDATVQDSTSEIPSL